MNATKHGFTALDVVLPGEDPADFEHFRAGILASLDPHGALENFFAEKCTSSEPIGQVGTGIKRGSGPSELNLWLRTNDAAGVWL
ncbi:MAG: hypothetical protein WCA22_14450, partial [Candidatus Binatus sp.]